MIKYLQKTHRLGSRLGVALHDDGLKTNLLIDY